MIVAWSDNDSSDSEDEEEQSANLCFMVNEDHVQEDDTEYESLDDIDCYDFLVYSKDELA